MSTVKSMQEVSVEQLMNNYNLIVPEIQREYVWGFNDYGILDTFIQDITEGFKLNNKIDEATVSEIETIKKLVDTTSDETTRKSLNNILDCLLSKSSPINIGFLYSYRPGYYVFNDRNDDLYLIDGQQRFTTLFLILYYLSIKEGKQKDFISTFRFNKDIEQIAFDYRVRTLTHNFFIDLLSNAKSVDDLLNIRNKNWFLSNYDNDVTVNAIVGQKTNEKSGVFNKLNSHFENDSNSYYEFVKTQIKFWHFKTEETSQGEELYITMNSRGQQLADNETIRAKLFDTDLVKSNPLEWGEKWEIWQDFFWKNRDKSNNEITADEGFNEFLRWIQIIKMTEIQEVIIDDDNEDSLDKKDIIAIIKWGKGKKLDAKYLSLDEIDYYFRALKYLFESFPNEMEKLKSNYSTYSNFNLIEKQWLCPVDNNNSIIQIDSFRLLPILYYCKNRIELDGTIDSVKLFRVIRFFYNLRSDATIMKASSLLTINAIKFIGNLSSNSDITDILDLKGISVSILNKEERKKLQIIKKSENRFRTEDLFWRAEDNEQNEGSIIHLIEFSNPHIISNQFNLDDFEEKLIIFEEFIQKKHYIWGNLIATDVYTESFDRISYIGNWHKQEGFLQLISTKQGLNTIGLKEFLIHVQKKFIQTYKTADDIINEKSFKKQIYIYYILQFNSIIINAPKWNWDFGWNFGAFASTSGYKTFFTDGVIFQYFRTNFREKDDKMLWIHKNIKNQNLIIENLLNWSKE
ncbi:DUF262 domain-containing protein [Flavobacterium marginilacus]|uniref:DUF262 domain-containing protein n=1 Tax=Flavobacterium marginilacus TaxID=3003256 RepID=UPI00248ECD6E|nr:DUF262 domain-containing protein [Flavobacterium marginilacus]